MITCYNCIIFIFDEISLLNKKLHILFLNSWYPSRVLPINGDFIQRHAEAVALVHNVTAVHVISDKHATHKIEIDRSNINSVETVVGYIKQTRNPILKLIRFIKSFQLIFKELAFFDLVHVNRQYPFGVIALYLKWFKKKPYIISEHWTGYQKSKKSIGFIEKFISKIITKNAAFVCPVSNNLANAMQELGLKGNYVSIPNVVDTAIFTPKDSLSVDFTMLHVSNMVDDHKNITAILKTLASFKKATSTFKFLLIGSDSNKFSALIDSLNLSTNVSVIDQVAHFEIANYMQRSNVFILFSNYENLPCVILESFACGLPVISTDVGGISEYFPHEFGTLVPTNNTEALLHAIQHHYNEKDTYSKKKMHEYATVNFSPKVICTKFTERYLKALSK